MNELEQIRQIQEQINILKKEYDYCKEITDTIEVEVAVRCGYNYEGMVLLDNSYKVHLERMWQINQQVFMMRCDLIRLNEQIKSVTKPIKVDYIVEYEG